MGLMDGDFSDSAPRDSFYSWVLGIIVAGALAWYGVSCVSSRTATLGSRHGTMHCEGPSAVALGAFWIAVAGLSHFHFFWSWRERYHAFGQLGTLASLFVAVGSIGYFVFRYFLDF